MSYQAMTWATRQRVGDPSLKLLLLVLANYANEEGELWHSQDRISFDTEIPIRTLRRKFTALVEAGLITVTERRREDGSRMTSLVKLLADQPAKMAESTTGQNSNRPKHHPAIGQNEGVPSANKVAAQESKESKESSLESIRARQADDWPSNFVEVFWSAYPEERRTAKKSVEAKLVGLRRRGEVTFERLMAGLRAYVATNPGEFAKAPVVWINGGCWDDANVPRAPTSQRTSGGNGYAQLLRQRQQQKDQEGFFHDDEGSSGPIIDGEFVANPKRLSH